jgi:tetratricopeptide (TPR) repeat protein
MNAMRWGCCVVLIVGAWALGVAPPVLGPARLTAEQAKEIAQWSEEKLRAGDEGKFDDAEKAAKKIVELREKWQGAKHWETIDARYDVEYWTRLTKVPVAKRAAMLRARQINGEGVGLVNKGKYDQAIIKLYDALKICTDELGEQHPDTATSYTNVAVCLNEQGQYKKSLVLHKKSLDISISQLGNRHPLVVTCYNNLASCLNSQGQHAEALHLFKRALNICKSELGLHHPSTATIYNNTAMCYMSQGKNVAALPLLENALAIRKSALGERHADTATSYNNLAMCLHDQRQYAKAIQFYERAQETRKGLFGEHHVHVAASYNNIATCMDSLQQHAKALPLHEKALEIFKTELGEGHGSTAESYNNLAYCLNEQGKHAIALPLYKKALEIRKVVFGEHHPDTAASYNNVASCLHSQGQHEKAIPLYKKSLEMRKSQLGSRHPDTATSLNNLGSCLNSQGQHAEALPLFEKALEIRQSKLGERHPDTATSYNNLASCLNSQGQHAKALPHFNNALEIRKSAFGDHHPDTAGSYNNLAYCLNSQGQHAKALPLHKKALEVWKSALGERHPLTATSNSGLGLCLYSLNKSDEAASHFRQALAVSEWSHHHAADSGFDRALFRTNAFSPRAGLALCLIASNKHAEAWHHAESDLSRGLLDDLSSDKESADELALRAEIDAINKQLVPFLISSKLEADASKQRESLLQQRKTLEDRAAEIFLKRLRDRVSSLADVQKYLAPNSAIVFWLDVLDKHYGCVVRQKGDPIFVSLKDKWTPDDDVLIPNAFATLANTNSPGERQKLLAAVAKQRLAPLEPHLKDITHLLVIPAGVMSKFPVETLTDKYTISYIPSASVFAKLMAKHRPLDASNALILADPVFSDKPLTAPPSQGILVLGVLPNSTADKAGMLAGDVILEYNDTRINSIDDLRKAISKTRVHAMVWRYGERVPLRLEPGVLGVNIDARPAKQAYLAWSKGDSILVASRDDKLSPLPGTRLEARILSGVVKSSTLLVGSDASEQKLERMAELDQLSKYRILHFGTHGQANPVRADLSALLLARDNISPHLADKEARVLAGKKPIDGRLTVETIRRTWTLDADLVTLSACETGLGVATARDGMLGFAQGLIEKGARSVVLSRWSVDDAATALFMSRFYENITGKREGLKSPMKRAEAMREAKGWLRNLSHKEIVAKLDSIFAGVAVGERGSIVEARPILPKLPAEGTTKEDKPFAAPYFWAGFILVGDPD